jgi:LuxR family maltose regulon positive regulatory protein
MRSSERRSGPFYANMLGTFGAFDGDWQAVRENLALIANAEASWDWPYVRVSKCALRAVLARHEGSLDEALQLYRSIGPGVLGISLWNLHSSTCVAWALAELQAGDAARAWQALSPALAMAVESDEVLGLLLCGPTALQELAHAPWPGDVAAVELAMLKRCARQARELGGTAPAAAPAATVTGAPVLSERELEVLRLVADGQSNKLIARALGLSPHTIKRHIARILDKTGQGSRGQAAAWLHALQTADG